mmetsp:Transcript_117336/g.332023  ORF Transcript_117336/g.332023 Transcript_117336/m.332023 type:complete len:105 (-) Transcript_117336:983-1297(-)
MPRLSLEGTACRIAMFYGRLAWERRRMQRLVVTGAQRSQRFNFLQIGMNRAAWLQCKSAGMRPCFLMHLGSVTIRVLKVPTARPEDTKKSRMINWSPPWQPPDP